MRKIGIFMANGCEEIEGLTVVDIVRRAGLEISVISISGSREVTGSHNITFLADTAKNEADYGELEGIILPGGMPGTLNLAADETVIQIVRQFAREQKLVAAICAAPGILGQEHILEGKKATCHPGFEDKLIGAEWTDEPVVVDGNVITSRGMGTAVEFGLAVVRYFTDEGTVEKLKKGLVYRG